IHLFYIHDTATPELYTLSLHDALPIFTVYPVRSASSSAIVGRRVNVKIVASIIDQKMSSMKAIHGTPGWRDVESSRVNGDMTTLFKVPQMSPAPSLSNPQIEPTSTRRKRAMPTQ